MSVFLVLSLFCGIVMLMDYMGISIWEICEYLYGNNGRKVDKNRKIIDMKYRCSKKKKNNHTKNSNKMGKAVTWMKMHKHVILSCFITVILGLLVVFIRNNIFIKQPATGLSEVYADKKIVSGIELEERGFVMSVIIGKDTVSYEIASEAVGMWQKESSYVTLKCHTVEESEKLYKENGDKRLDFSHLKMIFIDDEIYDDEKTKTNIEYIYEQERFAENILVCPLDSDASKMAAKAMEEGEAFAVKMEEIMVNSGKNEEMELYKVYSKMTQ